MSIAPENLVKQVVYLFAGRRLIGVAIGKKFKGLVIQKETSSRT